MRLENVIRGSKEPVCSNRELNFQVLTALKKAFLELLRKFSAALVVIRLEVKAVLKSETVETVGMTLLGRSPN